MKSIVKLGAAVVASAVAFSASAAEPFDSINDANTIKVVFSGATAPDKLLRKLIQNICASDYAEFSADSSYPSKAYSAYYCVLDAAKVPASVGAAKAVFYKRSAGGSFEGTVPVANSLPGIQLDLSSAANCDAPVAGQYNNCATVGGVVSDAGTSDLPPDVFFGPNVGGAGVPCDAACSGALNSAALTQLVFGIPVTNPLYIALQEAQGLDTDVNGNGTPDAEEKDLFKAGGADFALQGDYTDNMPSLTKEQVASLYSTAGIVNFSNLQFGGVSLTAAATTAPVNSNVHICRRVNGSGTQASFNLNIMNAPLNPANNAVISGDNTPCLNDDNTTAVSPPFCASATESNPLFVSNSTQIIIENSGSGNVTTCLDNLSDQNAWGLGVQSLEKQSSKWSFIKLDGVAPTLANTASGNYFHWGDVSMQWKSTMPAGPKLDLLTYLRSNMADTAELNSANQSNSVYPFGLSGSLSKTDTNILPFVETAPVAQWEHKGNNSFQIPQPRDNTQVDFQ